VNLSVETAVELKGLTKRFGAFTAVDNLSFSIPKGCIFGLLGPNGAGKTTTIRMLCGILLPSSGTGTVLGFDITRQTEQIKRNIGYMSQKFALYNDLTVVENLEFYAQIYNLKHSALKEKITKLVNFSGLLGHERQKVEDLSGAWRQRLALACSMVHEPAMIFLDEPTAGVDPVSRREFWHMIYALSRKGVTVLATTHYMDEAEYCHRIAMMYAARMVALDTPERLKRGHAGSLYEIDCSDPVSAYKILKGSCWLMDVALHGILIHATVASTKDKNKLLLLLKNANIRVDRCEISLPSLEDVFVSLVETQDRGAVRSGIE
jgi:ABC-2 type transport system ATP-binding protein